MSDDLPTQERQSAEIMTVRVPGTFLVLLEASEGVWWIAIPPPPPDHGTIPGDVMPHHVGDKFTVADTIPGGVLLTRELKQNELQERGRARGSIAPLQAYRLPKELADRLKPPL